jgi:DNA-binding CsgD family transcriptional regulator
MKIAVLGSGKIGGTLGRKWRAAGHEVTFGVRHELCPKGRNDVIVLSVVRTHPPPLTWFHLGRTEFHGLLRDLSLAASCCAMTRATPDSSSPASSRSKSPVVTAPRWRCRGRRPRSTRERARRAEASAGGASDRARPSGRRSRGAPTVNRAAGLFLSRATVEMHLKRVYARPAIDGRQQDQSGDRSFESEADR